MEKMTEYIAQLDWEEESKLSRGSNKIICLHVQICVILSSTVLFTALPTSASSNFLEPSSSLSLFHLFAFLKADSNEDIYNIQVISV